MVRGPMPAHKAMEKGVMVAERIAEAVTAMEFSAASEDLAHICHAHPTLFEVLHEAALACDKRALHF
jgi:dihydrolipoamide dehydrogenase